MTLHEVANRFRNIMGIGRVSLADDTGDLQMLQVTEGAVGGGMKDRVTDKVPRITEFGFSSVPPIDSEVVVLYRAGDRSKPVVMGTNHRPSRPKGLKPGDSVLHDDRGQVVVLTADGIIVDGSGLNLPVTVRNVAKLRVEATQIECTGDVVAHVDGMPISLAALAAAYLAHHHTGVSTGSGSTGLTDHTL